MGQRHAFLIMAHTNIEQLKKLVQCLDHELNDLYIHIDAHWKDFDEDMITDIVKKSGITFTKKIYMHWGGFSLVEARKLLLQKARENGPYVYYHLVSGMDLPLVSQKTVHDFFDKHSGKEFISVGEKAEWYLERVKYFYPFVDFIGQERRIGKIINKGFTVIQKTLHVNRIKNSPIEYYMGEEWFSVTESFVDYFLNNEAKWRKLFYLTNCSDEMIFPTMFMMWPDKNERYISNLEHPVFDKQRMDIVRAIDWQRGKPYTYTIDDYQMLLDSGCLFARKFNDKVDKEIIDRLVEYVMSEQ